MTERPRYAELSESLGWLADRQLIFGLHVHIGVGSADKAIACADGLRSSLPELVALSANSPFWQGRDTGLASTRVKISETLPRTGLPPALGSFAEFEHLVERGVRTGCFPDYTHIWWDVRPHPRLGTIEIRICDGQTRIESVAALAALIQSLVATLGSAFECDEEIPAGPDLLLEENRWRASPGRARCPPDRPRTTTASAPRGMRSARWSSAVLPRPRHSAAPRSSSSSTRSSRVETAQTSSAGPSRSQEACARSPAGSPRRRLRARPPPVRPRAGSAARRFRHSSSPTSSRRRESRRTPPGPHRRRPRRGWPRGRSW